MEYRRLNITLPDDVLARADTFAQRERYTRSALIAAALEEFVSGGESDAGVAREVAVAYAPEAVGINPAVKPLIPDIIAACRRHGVVYAALVGSSTQPDPKVKPRDLDILVRFPRGLPDRAQRYFGLIEELRAVTGTQVDMIEIDAIRNTRLRREFERTQVVLYETA